MVSLHDFLLMSIFARAQKLALTSGGTLKFEESIQHQLFHAEGRRHATNCLFPTKLHVCSHVSAQQG